MNDRVDDCSDDQVRTFVIDRSMGVARKAAFVSVNEPFEKEFDSKGLELDLWFK